MRLGSRATLLRNNEEEWKEGERHLISFFQNEENQKEGEQEKKSAAAAAAAAADDSLTLAEMIYGKVREVHARHRHRYEVNPVVVKQLESQGLRFTGTDDRGERMEITELPRSLHPYFFGCQYHPEYQVRKHGTFRKSFLCFAFHSISSLSFSLFLSLSLTSLLFLSSLSLSLFLSSLPLIS